MTATPPATGTPTPTAPTTLEGRLAADLRTAARALGERYDLGGATDPAHPRPMLLGDALVPGVVGAALDVVHDLEDFATNPPANLRTRARLGEQLAFRASTLAVVVEETAAALEVVAVPDGIAAAVDAVCAEVVRLGEHAAAFDGVTYDEGDEAGEAAGMMAAQVRGEVIGARRALAILLGMATGAEADGGHAEAYVTAWRNARTAAPHTGEVGT